MAVRFVVGLFSNVSVSLVSKHANTSLGPLAGFVQVREKKVRRTVDPFSCWVQIKRKPFEEYLTKESKDFIQEVIKYKYLQPNESPLKEPPWERGEWTPDSVRTGLIARKIGVYPMWTKTGRRLLTTLLQVVDNHVIRYHTPEVHATFRLGKKNSQDGKLGCIVVGAESTDPQKFTAQYNGLFSEAGVMPKKKLTRFFITPNAALQPGTPLYAAHFRAGDYVDVVGITVDHGFQGVVKRWGFKGGPRAHGCTKTHRRPGCIGGGVRSHTFQFSFSLPTALFHTV